MKNEIIMDDFVEERDYDKDIEEYRMLIIKRDRLKKQAHSYYLAYIREFGELIEENYKLKIECIKSKKIIAYCIACANNGERVYMDELQDHIAVVMHDYYEELKVISDTINAERDRISEFELHKIKKLYYQIVNMIHPDLHPKLFEYKEIPLLWQQAREAYENNDYDTLKDTEILIVGVIKKFGGEERKIELKNAKWKLSEIRTEIDKIIKSDPYMYKYILEDEGAVMERKSEMRQENHEYEEYLDELRAEIAKLQVEEN